MSTAVVPFQFQSSAIRTVTINGEHWFVAKDVAEALGYTNTSKAINDHCKGVTKRYPLQTTGGAQQARIIREPDLYRLIVGSTLPAAQEFEAWIFEEVLPALRKTGRYAAAEAQQAGRRFIAAFDHEGRMSMTELAPGEIVVQPKNLARMIADPAVRFAEDANEHLRALAEIATAATIRAHYNASVAREMLFDGPHARRAAELLASRGKA